MPTYTYLEASDLTRISSDLIQVASLSDPILRDVFPIVKRNTAKLRWRVDDNNVGLMALRGLDGEPTRASVPGHKWYEESPGYFGEFMDVTETEMTERANDEDITRPINVNDLVADRQTTLTYRQTNRMRQMGWTLALTGTLSITLVSGAVGFTQQFTPQAVTPSVLWSTSSTSTPLADLRALQPAYGKGTSTTFGATAKLWMNSETLNFLLSNTNANDLGGRRVEGGNTVNDKDGINRILLGQSLPEINIYDDGYKNDAGTFTYFIPTGKILVVGMRPNGEKPGEFQWTRNANNPGFAPGSYAFVKDYTSGPAQTVPPKIDVHQGFNGGTVIQRPTQLVVMTVSA